MATKTKRRTAASALRQLRNDRDWTQEQLESATTVSQTLISQIENGSRPLTYATASRLERALGMDRGALDDVVGSAGMGGYLNRTRGRRYTHVTAPLRTPAGRVNPVDVAA